MLTRLFIDAIIQSEVKKRGNNMTWKENQKEYVRNLILGYAQDMRANGFNIREIVDIKFSSATTFYGQCKNYASGVCKIKISMLAIASGDAKLRNTIIHELCHASAPMRAKHGIYWQELATRASKLYHTTIKPRTPPNADARKYLKSTIKYKVTCDCGREWAFQRRTKVIKLLELDSKLTCPYCGGHNFTIEKL